MSFLGGREPQPETVLVFLGSRAGPRAARKLRTNPSTGQTTNRLTAHDAAHRANVRESDRGHLADEELVDDVLHGQHHATWRGALLRPADKLGLSEQQ